MHERSKKTDTEKEKFHDYELLKKVSQNYDKIFANDPRVLKIDTTDKSEDEVFQLVLNDVKRILDES